eukprot:8475624-Alexandrium_andersonii.AAC.1
MHSFVRVHSRLWVCTFASVLADPNACACACARAWARGHAYVRVCALTPSLNLPARLSICPYVCLAACAWRVLVPFLCLCWRLWICLLYTSPSPRD